MAVTPPNAAFISKDGLATFDEFGRKLDSLGNVAWEDRQTLRGAGARPIESYWNPPQPEQPAPASVYDPLASAPAPNQWRAPSAPAAGGGQMPPGYFDPTVPPSTRLGVAPGQSNDRRNRGQAAQAGPAYNVYIPQYGAMGGAQYGQPLTPDQQRTVRDQATLAERRNNAATIPPGVLPYLPQNGWQPPAQPYDEYAAAQRADLQRMQAQAAAGFAPAAPTPMPSSTPQPQRVGVAQPMMAPQPPMPTLGTPQAPQRAAGWTPYAPYNVYVPVYGVNAPLPSLSPEDEAAINQAVLWR